LSIALITYLPAGLRVLVRQSERDLTARAVATPLLIGAQGSPLELVLNTLYFESDVPARTDFSEVTRVRDGGLARAIPMYVRFHARSQPIVGTSVDYFRFRDVTVQEGRTFAVLGECVLGAEAARELDVTVGGHVVSSPETVFDIAGVYPLRMKVVGVLAPTGNPDDTAVFVDVKTAWVIEGLGHGHMDMQSPEAERGVLRREGKKVVANASVVQYNEITEENMDSFHFHGDVSGFPITAVIAVPLDEKASALLRGRYLSDDERVQVVAPEDVMEELLDTVFTIESYVAAAVIVLGLSTLATAALVFMLSLRLRRREIETMFKIGAARGAVAGIIVTEIAVVIALALGLAASLTTATVHLAPDLIRAIVLS
jgi:putative ABC transport system permease protein